MGALLEIGWTALTCAAVSKSGGSQIVEKKLTMDYRLKYRWLDSFRTSQYTVQRIESVDSIWKSHLKWRTICTPLPKKSRTGGPSKVTWVLKILVRSSPGLGHSPERVLHDLQVGGGTVALWEFVSALADALVALTHVLSLTVAHDVA